MRVSLRRRSVRAVALAAGALLLAAPLGASPSEPPDPCAFLVVPPAPVVDPGFLLPPRGPSASPAPARPNCHTIPSPVPLLHRRA